MTLSRLRIPQTGFWAKLLRYGFSSGLALLVDVGLMLALVHWLHIHYLLAAAIGFSSGCLVAWVLSISIVFDDQSSRASSHNLFLFVLVGLLGLVLNHIILYIGVDLIQTSLLFAKAASAVCVFWFNFFLRGAYVFKDPDISKQPKAP